jgi:hypothetical protein
MKQRIDAKIEPDLLADVRAALPEKMTLTAAIEAGLRLWLRSIRRKPKA